MTEEFPRAAGDQHLQPRVPAEHIHLVAGAEYSIDVAGDSLYDPAAVGLAPTEDGTSFKVVGALEIGVPESPLEQADAGAHVFVVEVTNPNGITEVGLMGAERGEQGSLAATDSWQPLLRSSSGENDEVILGRHAKNDDLPGRTANKVDIASLVPGQPDGGLATVSREHVALRLEGFGDTEQLVVRDLDSKNGTQLVRAKEAERTAPAQELNRPAAQSRLVGSLAVPELITKVPLDTSLAESEKAQPAGLSPEEHQLIVSKIEGIDAMITADSRLAAVRQARQQIADIVEDKRQNWIEARKPGSDQEVFGRQSRTLQELEAAAREQLDRLPASDRDRYDSLMTEQHHLQRELDPPNSSVVG